MAINAANPCIAAEAAWAAASWNVVVHVPGVELGEYGCTAVETRSLLPPHLVAEDGGWPGHGGPVLWTTADFGYTVSAAHRLPARVLSARA